MAFNRLHGKVDVMLGLSARNGREKYVAEEAHNVALERSTKSAKKGKCRKNRGAHKESVDYVIWNMNKKSKVQGCNGRTEAGKAGSRRGKISASQRSMGRMQEEREVQRINHMRKAAPERKARKENKSTRWYQDRKRHNN